MSLFQNGHALIIGIGNDLPITINDANDISDVLVDSLKASYPKENVQVLTGKDATRANIEKGLDELISKTKNVEGSTAVLYYSGHGAQLTIQNNQQQYYLIPNDVNFKDLDSFLPAHVLTNKINQISSDKLLVLLDCCHAEGQFVQEKSLGGEEEDEEPSVDNINNQIVQQLNGGQGKVFIASCLNNEKSYIGVGDKNSLFTKHLISALEGRSSEDYDCVHVVDIIQYLFRKVPNEAKRKLGREQTPILNFADKLDANFFICMNSEREDMTIKSTSKSYNRTEDEVDTIATKIYNQTTNITTGDHGIALGGNVSGNVNITINHGNGGNENPSTGNHNKPKKEKNFFEQAREYIFENEIERAIDLLKDNLTDNKNISNLYLISSRWSSINQQFETGQLAHDKAEITKNQIKSSFLSQLEKFEEIEKRN